MERVDWILAQEVIEEIGRGFGLDDQLSLTTLRRSSWLNLLREHGKLRLSDHSATVAVVVTPDVWRQIEELAAAMKIMLDQSDQTEDADLDRLWSHRVRHERRPAGGEAERLRALLEEDAPRD